MYEDQDAGSLDLVVVSNRGPVEHHLGADGQIKVKRASGGVVTALTAFWKEQEFSWVASAITPGDRQIAKHQMHRKHDGSKVMISSPNRRPTGNIITSRDVDYVVVPEDIFHKHYEVFSNRFLWFLQHSMWEQLLGDKDKNAISEAWWGGYVPTNMAFAHSTVGAIKNHKVPIVMLHDYHLYLAARYIRQQAPSAVLQHFVHIPWPEVETWRSLPQSISREICRSLLANDIVGFQTVMSAHNFLQCCDNFLEDAQVDYVGKTVKFRNIITYVRVYPISVDVNELQRTMKTLAIRQYQEHLRHFCRDLTIVRVDRLDPSKNIARGFKAFEQLLDTHEEFVGKINFLAFLVPSRTGIAEYEQCYDDIMNLVQAINARFGRKDYRPIEIFYENDYHQALAGMSLSDVLLVNPLADGMNLVAKEGPIVSTRDSVLILSRKAGAFEQLIGKALSIEPRDIDGTAQALADALSMSAEERRIRAQAIRKRIEEADISDWIRVQMDDIARVMTERLEPLGTQKRQTLLQCLKNSTNERATVQCKAPAKKRQ